ncbi:tape measure protein [Xenorhabdus sp. Reich]|uniref:Tape measure protein n=1 Tax=Xenorhabdus littoralis TaxID=2582835 RepID=A0ABU4SL22_9GAMM|nr:tape measure protein [Xenorhabdus sp. Reich]MDX7999344.1 tape measure protein [Xenorhabdus sp. Reich]
MAEHQVGNIVYQVSMDVAQLLSTQRQLDSRLGQVEQRFNQTERSVQGAEKALSSISKVAMALTSALSVQQVAAYADAWVVVNNKLVNAVKANEALAEVTERVFNISQNARADLDSTAALYGRLERATRSYGMSANDVAKLTETVAKGLVVSGATAAESSSVMIQFSQAMASGVLRGEEFNSMSENGSRLIAALSDHLGVNIGQLRKMAAEGKLTSEVVSKAFLAQSEVIAKEFGKTSATMSQSIQVASNNLTQFFGQSTTVQTALKTFNSTLVTVSENMDLVSNVALVVAGVIGGRLVGALALATQNKITLAAASINAARAAQVTAQNELYAAQTITRRTWADKDAAASALNLAQAEYQVARGSAAEALALDNLNAKKSAAISASAAHVQAKNAETAATERSAAANRAASITLTGLKGALSLVGGPMGAAMLAGGAIFYYYQQVQQAKQASMEFGETLPDVIKKLKEMNNVQAEASGAKTIEYIKNLKDEMNDLEEELKEANREQKKSWDLAFQFGVTTDQNNGHMVNYNKNVRKAKELAGEIYTKKTKLADAEGFLALIYKRVNETIVEQMKAAKENAEAHDKAISSIARMTGAQDHFAQILGMATGELKEFNAEYLKINWGGEEGEKLIKQAKRRLALSKLEGKARAEQQAEYDAEDAGTTDPNAINALKETYAQIWENGEASKKSNKKSTKSANEAAEALKRQQEALDRLNTGYQEGSIEMAKYDAVKALGSKATPKQIMLAKAAAAELYKIEQRRKDKEYALEKDALAKAEKIKKEESEQLERVFKEDLIKEEQYNQRRLEIAANYSKAIADIKTNKVVTPQQELTAQIDPIQELANRHKKQLEMIAQFETEKSKLTQRGIELMNAANTKYEQDRLNASWEIWRNQNQANQFLADSLDALGSRSANAITGLLTGTQSANEAMRNLALTITNEAVSALVQMGIQQIKNMVIGKVANTAAATSAAVTGASITASMAPAAAATSVATMGTAATVGMMAMATAVPAMIALLGARKNGGPVSPNGAYRIGENNQPEILKANNGHQYLLPGDRGKVVSNRDMGKGGNTLILQQTNQITIKTQGGVTEQDARMISNIIDAKMTEFAVNQMRDDGLFEKIGY